ncbi:MAG TPA: FKBP-type peptidyl-prolyl cis-trans isomerase [Patescibacteria group bacterium]|nr:FKBP-type peptidyl-prolyl cis-trans isomerase [Patescibacteria group bacterium]
MSTSTPEAIQELKVETISEGTGEGAKAGDKLSVLYTGTLTDGTVFDASSLHGNIPFTFQLGAHEVIEGWDQGMTGAKKGEKRKLWIPPDLAYGNASLIFEVEILDVISAE